MNTSNCKLISGITVFFYLYHSMREKQQMALIAPEKYILRTLAGQFIQ